MFFTECVILMLLTECVVLMFFTECVILMLFTECVILMLFTECVSDGSLTYFQHLGVQSMDSDYGHFNCAARNHIKGPGLSHQCSDTEFIITMQPSHSSLYVLHCHMKLNPLVTHWHRSVCVVMTSNMPS